MRYYFVSFAYGASEKTIQNLVIDTHPLDWQRDCNRVYPGQYKLITWVEITGEEYYRYREVINR